MRETDKEELMRKLTELIKSDDPEIAHGKADDLLLDYIDDEGVKSAFDNIPKWYA